MHTKIQDTIMVEQERRGGKIHADITCSISKNCWISWIGFKHNCANNKYSHPYMASLVAVHVLEVIRKLQSPLVKSNMRTQFILVFEFRQEMFGQVVWTWYNLLLYNDHPNGHKIQANGAGRGEGWWEFRDPDWGDWFWMFFLVQSCRSSSLETDGSNWTILGCWRSCVFPVVRWGRLWCWRHDENVV